MKANVFVLEFENSKSLVHLAGRDLWPHQDMAESELAWCSLSSLESWECHCGTKPTTPSDLTTLQRPCFWGLSLRIWNSYFPNTWTIAATQFRFLVAVASPPGWAHMHMMGELSGKGVCAIWSWHTWPWQHSFSWGWLCLDHVLGSSLGSQHHQDWIKHPFSHSLRYSPAPYSG